PETSRLRAAAGTRIPLSQVTRPSWRLARRIFSVFVTAVSGSMLRGISEKFTARLSLTAARNWEEGEKTTATKSKTHKIVMAYLCITRNSLSTLFSHCIKVCAGRKQEKFHCAKVDPYRRQ